MGLPMIAAGDKVTWTHVPRGGYGFAAKVPATVIQVYRSRARIVVRNRPGGVLVPLSSLTPRSE